MNDTASILVVDDNVDIGINMSDILADMGYDTDVATNGSSALKLIESKTYDVALLDFKMPDMDGATLYERIKTLQPDLVAIMITAYAGSNGVNRAKSAGTWRVLGKPVDIGSLLNLIDVVLKTPLVLVVDDDTDFCLTLWDLLREQHYRVGIAHSEQEAQQRLQARHYDVVLLDLKLKDDDAGDRVFQFLQHSDAIARTILMTGYRTEMQDAIDKLLQNGASCVYYKPLELDALLARLRELV